jgi:hypothetical protein
MRVETSQTETLTIREAGNLDPVTVFLQDFGGCGRITLECWGRAWSTYFGAIGNETLREFVLGAHPEYIANRMEDQGKSQTARTKERAYLERIIRAAQDAIKETL